MPFKVNTPVIVISGSDMTPIPVMLNTPYILKKSFTPVISVLIFYDNPG